MGSLPQSPFRVSRAVATSYRLTTAAVGVLAVCRVIGVGSADFAPGGLLYYTSLSNLLAVLWSLFCLVATLRRVRRDGWAGDASIAPRVGAGVALALVVTMLVYLVILAPTAFTQDSSYEPFTLTDNLVHIVVPILAVGDWVLFARKGRLRWVDPLWWAAIPYAYVAFALLRPLFVSAEWPGGGHYPYPFLDVDANGWGVVLLWLIALTVVIEAIAFGIVALDHMLARRAQRTS